MSWYVWAFDGVGGAVGVATVGFLVRRILSKSQSKTPAVRGDHSSFSDSNVAIGSSVTQRISVHYPGPDFRPRIVFRATPLPASKWSRLEGTPVGVFSVTHIGGDAARFIKIKPIQSVRGHDLWVSFDEIDLLDRTTREVHPNFALVIGGTRRFEDRTGNLYFVFFARDSALTKKDVVDYLVTIEFRWNKETIEERVTLTWDNVHKRLTTSPAD